MSRIHGKDTKIELLLRKELWKRGFRYRKNYRKLPGTPDIVFIKQKIAIFCDSEFWHGHHFLTDQKVISRNNNHFWKKKISRNIERDLATNEALKQMGWRVLRFWDYEIEKHQNTVLQEIGDEYANSSEQNNNNT